MAGLIGTVTQGVTDPLNNVNPSQGVVDASKAATDPTNVTTSTDSNTNLAQAGTTATPSTDTTGTGTTGTTSGLINLPTLSPAPVTQARAITEDETVSGQLNKLLSGSSAYIQNARNRAMETMNERGLINSSMAAGAGERAAIEAALPIATQDSTVYANSGQLAQQGNQDATLTNQKANISNQQAILSHNITTAQNQQNIDANIKLQADKLASSDKQQYLNDVTSYLQSRDTRITAIQQMTDQQIDPVSRANAINAILNETPSVINALGAVQGLSIQAWPVQYAGGGTGAQINMPAVSDIANVAGVTNGGVQMADGRIITDMGNGVYETRWPDGTIQRTQGQNNDSVQG